MIDSGPGSGVENMAMDEALFRCFDPASSMPVLRLYGWTPPALSLGRFQKAADLLDLRKCARDNLTIVRRITGGGAIYHSNELTYSLIFSQAQIPTAKSVKESFKALTAFLLGFYRTLGLSADYAVNLATDKSRLGDRTALCFAGRESYDILVNNRKIGGNAQRRTRDVIFQHGSIPITNRIEQGLAYVKSVSCDSKMTATSLKEEGIWLDLCILKQILLQQFKLHLGVMPKPDSLTEKENSLYQTLSAEKYCSRLWNMDGILN